jgi:hypothetical protein
MLRPYRGSPEPQLSSFSTLPRGVLSRSKRTVFVLGLPFLLLVGMMGMSGTLSGFMPHHGMRKLVVQCIHTIYAESTQAAVDMPRPPSVSAAAEVPSIYAICQVRV